MQTSKQIEEFLSNVQVGVLSTVDSQGRPHAIPMWCIYEDGEFVMSTGLGSQKHKNIQNNENVMLVFDQRETPYYAVMVRGIARLETVHSTETIQRIAQAYLGEEGANRYLGGRPADAESATIRVTPTKFIEYHGLSGR